DAHARAPWRQPVDRPGPPGGVGGPRAQSVAGPGCGAGARRQPRDDPEDGSGARMSTVGVYDTEGKRVGEVALPPFLDRKPHTAVLHEALLWQLAGRRRGTHSTLTRGLVNRTTKKLYRQKGTGRARHGAGGAPLF